MHAHPAFQRLASEGIPDRDKVRSTRLDSFDGINEPITNVEDEIKKRCANPKVITYVKVMDMTGTPDQARQYMKATDLIRAVQKQAKRPDHLFINEVETVQPWSDVQFNLELKSEELMKKYLEEYLSEFHFKENIYVGRPADPDVYTVRPDTVRVNIHKIPLTMPDEILSKNLEMYGTIVGGIKRSFHAKPLDPIKNGSRHCFMRVKHPAGIPPIVDMMDNPIVVSHYGQIRIWSERRRIEAKLKENKNSENAKETAGNGPIPPTHSKEDEIEQRKILQIRKRLGNMERNIRDVLANSTQSDTGMGDAPSFIPASDHPSWGGTDTAGFIPAQVVQSGNQTRFIPASMKTPPSKQMHRMTDAQPDVRKSDPGSKAPRRKRDRDDRSPLMDLLAKNPFYTLAGDDDDTKSTSQDEDDDVFTDSETEKIKKGAAKRKDGPRKKYRKKKSPTPERKSKDQNDEKSDCDQGSLDSHQTLPPSLSYSETETEDESESSLDSDDDSSPSISPVPSLSERDKTIVIDDVSNEDLDETIPPKQQSTPNQPPIVQPGTLSQVLGAGPDPSEIDLNLPPRNKTTDGPEKVESKTPGDPPWDPGEKADADMIGENKETRRSNRIMDKGVNQTYHEQDD